MDTINAIGKFWFPEFPEKQEVGIIRFSPEEGATLLIVGDERDKEHKSLFFNSPLIDMEELSANIPRIDGIAMYDIDTSTTHGRRFVLEDCTPIGSTINSSYAGNISSCSFSAQFIYETNILWDSKSEIAFDKVSFVIEGVEGWISGLTNFEHDSEWQTDGNGKERLAKETVSLSVSFPDLAIIPDIGSLEVCANILGKYDRHESALSTNHFFEIEFTEKKKFPEILKIAGCIQNLLQLATDEFHKFISFNVTVSDLEEDITNVRFRPIIPIQEKKKSVHPKLRYRNSKFTYSDIGGSEGISKWIETLSKRDEIDWKFAIAYLLGNNQWDNSPAELTFFSVITGALLLSPETKSRPDIKSRLKYLYTELGEIVPKLDDDWFQAMASLRNKFVVHPEAKREHNWPSDGSVLYARNILFLICVSYVLQNILGLSPEILKKKIWENNETKQYIAYSKSNNIVEWYRRTMNQQSYDNV